MAKRSSVGAIPRAWRPARSPVQDVRARFGDLDCEVVNLSTTGAMVRSRAEMAVGREVPVALCRGSESVPTRVRVIRCEPVEMAMPGEVVWRRRDYALGLLFLERSRALAELIRVATRETSGIEHTEPRILVIGKEDEISRLIGQALTDGECHPRIVTQPRYAISTAKRIGAKAIIVNLEIDPDFSARAVFDALRADPATSSLPIFICARHAWLRPVHQQYIENRHLRLLLVPFTPEELLLSLGRALDDRK